MYKDLTLETVVDFKLKGGVQTLKLEEVYDEERYTDLEEFFATIEDWVRAGKAVIRDTRTDREKIADKIADELGAVRRGQNIAQERVEKLNYNSTSHGIYKKVAFPAKTLMDANEFVQMLMRNFGLKQEQLGVEMQGTEILVTISNCPVKTYAKIERAYGIRRGTEAVTNTVQKTADTLTNSADIAVNTLAVPVAKTALGAGGKIAKTLVSCIARVGGIAVTEISRNAKQCTEEIRNDSYIAEAKGEVIDGVHGVRRTFNKKFNIGAGGIILE